MGLSIVLGGVERLFLRSCCERTAAPCVVGRGSGNCLGAAGKGAMELEVVFNVNPCGVVGSSVDLLVVLEGSAAEEDPVVKVGVGFALGCEVVGAELPLAWGGSEGRASGGT